MPSGGFRITFDPRAGVRSRHLEPQELPDQRIAELERQLRQARGDVLDVAKAVRAEVAEYWQQVAQRERDQLDRVILLLDRHAGRKTLLVSDLRAAMDE